MKYFILLPVLVASVCQQFSSAEDIREPPSITVSPIRHVVCRKEQTVDLRCAATGIPQPTYEWLHNQVTLDLNRGNIKRLVDGDLQIVNAGPIDEGYYQCIASNKYGRALSNVSRIQVAYLDTYVSATSVQEKEVNEGEPFSIEISRTKSSPAAQYHWASAVRTDGKDHDQRDLQLQKRIQQAENGNLYFAYATLGDSLGGRIYKGIASNPYVDITAGGSYTSVKVIKMPGGVRRFPPSLAFSSTNVTVGIEGNNISLRCFFNGNPDVNIQWERPGSNLPRGVKSQQLNSNTELKIFRLEQNDAGEYVCRGRNDEGHLEHRMQLLVQAVPVFQSLSDRPHDINVTEGEAAVFRCKPYAKPGAVVTWFRNGERLDLSNLPKRFSITPDQTTLTVHRVCKDCEDRRESPNSDLMVIQCNASNVHGSAFAAGYLNVLKATTVSLTVGETNVVIEEQTKRTLTYQCISSSDPFTTSKVTWYKVNSEGKPESIYSRPPLISVANGSLMITANSSESWHEVSGQYKCVASNGYSKAEELIMIKVNIAPPKEDAQVVNILDLWWLFVIIALVLALLIFIICCCCLYRNRGDKYDVDGKERKSGNDPEKELINSGFQDYQRREIEPFKGSQNSLGSSARLFGEDSASDIGDVTPQTMFLDNRSNHSASYLNTIDRKKGRNEVL